MNKFDKLVWRINGVMILLVGMGAVFILIFSSFGIKQFSANESIVFHQHDKSGQAVVVENASGTIIKKTNLPRL